MTIRLFVKAVIVHRIPDFSPVQISEIEGSEGLRSMNLPTARSITNGIMKNI